MAFIHSTTFFFLRVVNFFISAVHFFILYIEIESGTYLEADEILTICQNNIVEEEEESERDIEPEETK